jgi:hypothetical protein
MRHVSARVRRSSAPVGTDECVLDVASTPTTGEDEPLQSLEGSVRKHMHRRSELRKAAATVGHQPVATFLRLPPLILRGINHEVVLGDEDKVALDPLLVDDILCDVHVCLLVRLSKRLKVADSGCIGCFVHVPIYRLPGLTETLLPIDRCHDDRDGFAVLNGCELPTGRLSPPHLHGNRFPDDGTGVVHV